MSGLQRIVRHPDRLNDPHTRAHELASEALFDALDEGDAAWLAEHLAGCDPCRLATDAFAADAALLRGLRDDPPPVPRDLGARLSLALDDEVRRATRGRAGRAAGVARGAGSRTPGRRPSLAFAGLAAVAVVALLVGPLAAPLGAPAGTPPPATSLLPQATPITVDTQPVAWVSRKADGTYVISSATVGEVCPGVGTTACGTLDGSARTVASLDVKPRSVLLSNNGSPTVVVGQDAVYAIAVDFTEPVTTPVPEASPVPTNTPAQSPAASGEPASPPADSPEPSGSSASPSPSAPASPSPEAGSPDPSVAPSPEPGSRTPEPSPALTPKPGSPTPGPTDPAASPADSPEPTQPATSPEPTLEATPIPATPLPTLPPATPGPTAATALKIADGVVLVGASPAYSPDGRWVAFSAAPADGSRGPDVYAWRVGQKRARILTSDHGSVFSAWLDGHILASAARVAGTADGAPSGAVPPADADPATVVARSFLVDPARGTITQIGSDDIWRPVVDPTERVAVYWKGSLAWSDVQQAWIPARGHLVAADWKALLDGSADAATRSLPRKASSTSVAVWEVRFDPAGRRLGVWVADPADPGAGRLALVNVDADGTLGAVVLSDAAALSGFSLDADRLAWSTPPGRNGEGSLVTVYAWRGDAAGQLRSMPDPGNEPVVVAH